jgi:hypothetical protein
VVIDRPRSPELARLCSHPNGEYDDAGLAQRSVVEAGVTRGAGSPADEKHDASPITQVGEPFKELLELVWCQRPEPPVKRVIVVLHRVDTGITLVNYQHP